MQVPSITALGPEVTEKLTIWKNLTVTGQWKLHLKCSDFTVDLEIIKMNIFSKIHEEY